MNWPTSLIPTKGELRPNKYLEYDSDKLDNVLQRLKFLDELIVCKGRAVRTCENLGIKYTSFIYYMKADTEFKEAVELTREMINAQLLTTLEEISFRNAENVDSKTGVTDRIFLMKSLDRAKYDPQKHLIGVTGESINIIFGTERPKFKNLEVEAEFHVTENSKKQLKSGDRK